MKLGRKADNSISILQLWFKEQELISDFLRESYSHSYEKLLRDTAGFTWTAVKLQSKLETVSETSSSFSLKEYNPELC